MLSSIRHKTKGWIAYTIIGLIIVPFALFGIAEYSTGTANVIVASINDDEISKEAFLSKFNQQKRLLQQQLGDDYSAEFDNRVKRSVIEAMVNERLLDQLAKDLGHATVAAELQAIVQSSDDFKVDGRFSLDRYKQLLRLNGYSVTQYEVSKLNELTQIQIKQNLLDSAFVGTLALQHLQRLNNQQRKFRYIRLNTDDYTDKVSIDNKQIEAHYQEQKASFFEPEQVKLDFVELSLEQISKSIQVSDEELRDFYQQEQQRFATEEERQAQHILLKNEADAQKVLDKLKQGGDFAKLARQYSQDNGSKDNAGDLGFFARGVMVPEFEERAFAMQENELSDLVKSEFGYHIIKLNKIKASEVKLFDSVKAELLDLYTQNEAKKQLYNLVEQLANLAYEASLEELANQMDLPLQTTDFFNQSNAQLDRKMVNAAFSDVVLNQGENSEVLELSKDKFVVIRLKQKIPQRQKTFDEVSAQIETSLAIVAAKELIDKIATRIATLLRQGDSSAAKKLIKQHQLEWQALGWVKRDSNKAEAKIIQSIFTLPKPSAGRSTYNAGDFSKNYAVVVELSAVEDGEISTVDKALESTLLILEADEIFQAIVATLRQDADLNIFINRL